MTTPPATERTWLDNWVQPQHIAAEAVERYHASFAGDALHLLITPDFFVSAVAERIGDFLATEAAFTQQFAVTTPTDPPHGAGGDDHHERLVPEAEWLATPPKQRFLRFAIGPGQPRQMSPAWMKYLSLRAALHDARFASYVESLTGLSLGPVSSLSAHAMAVGDMLAPHSDVNLRRQLAFLFYFSRPWQPSYGGALLVTGLDGAVTRIEPAFNTMVLFEVTSHKFHRVETIAEAAGTARRLSLGGWFDHPLPGA